MIEERQIRNNFLGENRFHKSYSIPVNPESAFELQVARYRRMTGEQRLGLALELHELACDLARAGIKAQHPDADADVVERLLAQRLQLVTGKP